MPSGSSLLVKRLERLVDGLGEVANDLEQIDRDLRSLEPQAPKPRPKLTVVAKDDRETQP